MNVDESRLVTMAEKARRPTRWWLAWIVVLVIVVAVQPLGLALGNLVLGDPGRTQAWYPYVDAVASLAVLLALYLWLRFKEGRSFSTVGLPPGRRALSLLVGVGVGGGLVSIGVVLGLVLGVYETGDGAHTRTGADAVLALVPLALLLLLQAAGQEAVSRGYLLQISVRQLPAWVAVIGTSALVTVLQSFNPVTMLNAFLYAMLATFVALQQGSLWLVIGIHAGWGFFQLNVFGLPAGGIFDATSLWSIGPAPDGSAFVSGGYFGLDAGLLGTGLLAAATVVAYLRLRRTRRTTPTPAPAAPQPPARREPTHVTAGV